jgi:hypothetical protein
LNEVAAEAFVLDIQTLVADLADLGQELAVLQIDLVQFGLLLQSSVVFAAERAKYLTRKTVSSVVNVNILARSLEEKT